MVLAVCSDSTFSSRLLISDFKSDNSSFYAFLKIAIAWLDSDFIVAICPSSEETEAAILALIDSISDLWAEISSLADAYRV